MIKTNQSIIQAGHSSGQLDAGAYQVTQFVQMTDVAGQLIELVVGDIQGDQSFQLANAIWQSGQLVEAK